MILSSAAGRHDFGTYVLQKTGNIAVVINAMGHSDVKTAMTYQHPELNIVRETINARNAPDALWHVWAQVAKPPKPSTSK